MAVWVPLCSLCIASRRRRLAISTGLVINIILIILILVIIILVIIIVIDSRRRSSSSSSSIIIGIHIHVTSACLSADRRQGEQLFASRERIADIDSVAVTAAAAATVLPRRH